MAIARLTDPSSNCPSTNRAVFVPSLMLGPPLQVSAGPRGVASTAGAASISSQIKLGQHPDAEAPKYLPFTTFPSSLTLQSRFRVTLEYFKVLDHTCQHRTPAARGQRSVAHSEGYERR